MDNFVSFLLYFPGDVIGCYWIGFTSHAKWKGRYTLLDRPLVKSAGRLADQMSGMSLSLEPFQKIKDLLFPTPVGSFSIDVEALGRCLMAYHVVLHGNALSWPARDKKPPEFAARFPVW